MSVKISKAIRVTLIVLLALIIIISALFSFYGEKMVTMAAKTAASSALNVDVDIDAINFKLFGGEGQIKGLVVGNPADFKLPYAMSMEKGEIAIDTSTLLDETVHIKKIHLNDIHINFEQKGLKSNFQVITEGITPEKTDKKEPTTPAGEGEKSGSKKDVVVDELKITNAKVTVKLIDLPIGGMDKMTFTLPEIVMNDVGKDKKLTFAELSELIFGTITKTILEAGSGIIPADLGNALGGALNGAMDVLGDLGGGLVGVATDILETEIISGTVDQGKKAVEGTLEQGKKAIEGVGDTGKAIGEEAGKVLEGIGGIFGGSKKEEDKTEQKEK